MTPWEQYLEKKKEKRKAKKNKKKSDKKDGTEDEDPDKPFSDDELPDGFDPDDPFFKSTDDDKGKGKRKKDKKKGKKNQTNDEVKSFTISLCHHTVSYKLEFIGSSNNQVEKY
jgi:hypothetical protein